MKSEIPQESRKSMTSIYQIKVKGAFAKNWSDWFNGMLIDVDPEVENGPYTTLTCQVRDQAELLGILNWLNSLNLPLLQVALVRNGEDNDMYKEM